MPVTSIIILTKKQLTQIEEATPIQYNTEQGEAALIYGKARVRLIPVQKLENGKAEIHNGEVSK